MPLRLNIGRVPEPESGFLIFPGAEIAPVRGDPFGSGPPQDAQALYGIRRPGEQPPPAGGPQDPSTINLGGGPPPNTRQPPPAGASPPEPSVPPDQSVFPSGGTGGPRLAPVSGDPFGGG